MRNNIFFYYGQLLPFFPSTIYPFLRVHSPQIVHIGANLWQEGLCFLRTQVYSFRIRKNRTFSQNVHFQVFPHHLHWSKVTKQSEQEELKQSQTSIAFHVFYIPCLYTFIPSTRQERWHLLNIKLRFFRVMKWNPRNCYHTAVTLFVNTVLPCSKITAAISDLKLCVPS